jgi:hypothetical protein
MSTDWLAIEKVLVDYFKSKDAYLNYIDGDHYLLLRGDGSIARRELAHVIADDGFRDWLAARTKHGAK